MAHTSVNPARMFYRLEFGHLKAGDHINPNTGKRAKGFAPEFTRWAGKWSISQSMQLSLAGANINNAVVFFIRHDESIDTSYHVRLGKKEYTIKSISYDQSMVANAFDLLTCQEVEKNS